MQRYRLIAILVVMVLLGSLVTTAFAQSYNFSVPEATVIVTVETNGTLTLDYTYTFQNLPGSPPIEFVDIGMPRASSYDPNEGTAEIDGQPLSHIAHSEFVSNAIEVGLGNRSIQPGDSGTVHFNIRNVRNTIFPSDNGQDEAYAGLQFQPNFFEGGTVEGSTDMAVTLLLPPGMTEDEPIYYPPEGWPGDTAPGSGITAEDRVFYTWEATNADLEDEYVFGAAFPARLVPADVIAEPWEPEAGEVPSGTGTITFNSDAICPAAMCLGFLGITGASIYFSIKSAQKRKLAYLPPKISVEGHGVKRGLTAVEAAILMEQPMDKIMTMILYSVLRKEAAEVISNEPLKLKVDSPLPEGLQLYEVEFLKGFETDSPAERRRKLQDVMVDLVKGVSQKMKGFSQKETVAYYTDIMKRAWNQITTAGTPEMKGEVFEEVLPWTMLDQGFGERSREAFGSGPVFAPTWWWRTDPTLRPHFPTTGGIGTGHTAAGVPSSTGGGSRTIQLPNLPGGDFAASMVRGIENFSAGVIGNLTDFTGGVTNKTNPMPKPTTTYRGGGGGGRSCACACACAGCACACAGGGR